MSVTAATVAKITTALAKDKHVQKFIGAILGIALGIIILIIGCFFTIGDAISHENQNILSYVFDENSAQLTDAPPETIEAVENIRASFDNLDTAIEDANKRLGHETLDTIWIKSIFFTLYFEKEQPADDFYEKYVDCFITTTTVDGEDTEVTLKVKNDQLNKLNNDLQLTATEETISTAEMYYAQIKQNKVE